MTRHWRRLGNAIRALALHVWRRWFRRQPDVRDPRSVLAFMQQTLDTLGRAPFPTPARWVLTLPDDDDRWLADPGFRHAYIDGLRALLCRHQRRFGGGEHCTLELAVGHEWAFYRAPLPDIADDAMVPDAREQDYILIVDCDGISRRVEACPDDGGVGPATAQEDRHLWETVRRHPNFRAGASLTVGNRRVAVLPVTRRAEE
jgi:hypothetical protein